ncbi:MAG TPA: AAA family ATPase [Pyrinomonadaceae bacterium]|jgi:predicted ATP-binding protein involved in virulence
MKIRKLHLKNIGVFDDQEIEFKPCSAKDKAEIHIFTGQNGSGKSTILMALASNFEAEIESAYPNTLNLSFFFLPAISNRFYKRSRTKSQISFNLQFQGKKKHYSYVNSLDSFTHSVDTLGRTGFASREVFSYQDQIDRNFRLYSSSLKQGVDLSRYSFNYAAFAFSGYRQIKSERIEAIKEPPDFNPLYESLEFIKDYSEVNQLTINQLIANNISKSGIEHRRGDLKKSERFTRTVQCIEKVISEITGWKIEFDLQTEPINLVTKINGEELDFDVLPDGLRSLISWIADLAGRVDLLKWEDDLPIFEKNLILFLDEIEIHLHPAWQRKVLPVVQKLFKNSQIFISTHSPFVINSVDDAWVYKLELENGKARVADVVLSEDGLSYQTVLREIFGIDKRFGGEAQNKLDDFYRQRDSLLKANGKGKLKKKDFLKLAKDLASQSAELQSLVFLELARLSKETGEPYEI